jgi:CRP-like cAMP-binding protein
MPAHVAVPQTVVDRLRTTPDLLGVFALLAQEAGQGASVALSGDGLARLVGCSRATGFRLLRRLEAADVVRSERQPSATVRHLVVSEALPPKGGATQ